MRTIMSKFKGKAKAPMQDRGMAMSAPGRAKPKAGGFAGASSRVVGKPMKPSRASPAAASKGRGMAAAVKGRRAKY